jgi:hypothetical protein
VNARKEVAVIYDRELIMPICPNCRLEYKEGITVCPDCGSELIPFPLEDNHEDSEDGEENLSDDYIEIARFRLKDQVEMVLSIFRSKGIPAILRPTPNMNSHQSLSPDKKDHDYIYSLLVSLDFAAEADYEGEIILGEAWKESKQIGMSD